MRLFRHAGLEELAPYLIRGHPESLESTGFWVSPRDETGQGALAGMTTFMETIVYRQTLFSDYNYIKER
jgi:hypothetical protein